MVAISFSNINLKSQTSVQNIQGVLILIISELVFTHMYYVIYIFPEEMVIFVREKSLYSSLPYYLSKVLSLVSTRLFRKVPDLTQTRGKCDHLTTFFSTLGSASYASYSPDLIPRDYFLLPNSGFSSEK